jgi:HD-GYP domain-containing protein (c-di-GMP phosphodiesterase class II)
MSETLGSMIDDGKAAERAGEWDAALSWYERALARCGREGDAACAADLLRWVGTVRRVRGDLELATEAYDASLTIAELNGLRSPEAAALNCLAIAEQLRGNVDLAAGLYGRARHVAQLSGDRGVAIMIEQNMGALADVQGRPTEALAHFQLALGGGRELDDRRTIASALNNIGKTHVALAQWAEAAACFEEAAAVAEAGGDLHLAGTVELNRAELHLKCSRTDAARAACERALSIFDRLRSRASVADVYKLYGILYRRMGETARADAHLALALGLAEAVGDLLLQAETHVEWAALHLEERRWQQGITYLNRGFRLFGHLKARREVLDIQRRLERAENLYLSAVKEWGASLAAVDGSTDAGHPERVALYSCALADAVDVTGWDLTVVRVGALIHDVGRAAVHHAATTGRGAHQQGLERWRVIAGDALARQFDFPGEAREIVRHHRERWDGTGYPDRLAGAQIPLGARIVSIADELDSLLAGTATGTPVSEAEAVARLMAQGGTRFDPALLAHLEPVLERAGRQGGPPPRVPPALGDGTPPPALAA